MKIHLVSVADDRFKRKSGLYETTQLKITEYANHCRWFNSVRNWKFEDIQNSKFYTCAKIQKYITESEVLHPTTGLVLIKKNQVFSEYNLFDDPDPAHNGRAYKPLCIFETLCSIDINDYLIYTDCSPEMWNDIVIPQNANPKVIIDLCEANKNILTAHVRWNHLTHVENGIPGYHTHENFTTNTCMDIMGLKHLQYNLQHASGFMVIKNTTENRDLIYEWLNFNINPDCGGLGHRYNPNLWFIEESIGKIGHRHDQSISGLLMSKNNHSMIQTLDWYERPKNMSPYSFFNYTNPSFNYTFIPMNQPIANLQHRMCRDENQNNFIKIDER